MFTAFESPDGWRDQRKALTEAKVTDRLFDCSDAHYWSASSQKDRIGNCWNWVRADHTFAGLKHALLQYDSRVYVGLEPPDIGRARTEPETIIRELSVNSGDGVVRSPFDYSLVLNQRYVAIVGNKGQGKSALVDCIARAGNSSRDEFAFLNKRRFLAPKNLGKAGKFTANIQWASGESRSVTLISSFDKSSRERVEYLPQSFVERVCSSDPQESEATEFEAELKAVLFTHIPEEERRGATQFDDLLRLRTVALDRRIEALKNQVRELSKEYEELIAEIEGTSVENVKGQLDELERSLESARDELALAEKALKAAEKASPRNRVLTDATRRLKAKLVAREELAVTIASTAKAEGEIVSAIERADDLWAQLRLSVAGLKRLAKELSALFGIDESEESLVQLIVSDDAIERHIRDLQARKSVLSELRLEAQASREITDAEILALRAELEKIDQVRELARRQRDQVSERVAGLVGSNEDRDSVLGLRKILEHYRSLPSRLALIRSKLAERAKEIHLTMDERLDTVSRLYQPASDFIMESPIASEAGVTFSADLFVGLEWSHRVDELDLRKSPDLASYMQDVQGSLDVHDPSAVLGVLEEVLDRLCHERGGSDGTTRDPRDSIKSKFTLGEFIASMYQLEWIDLRIGLSGQGVSLQQLSPGQRGLILLLFYLIVDKRSIPLLLDQPEENLDNETIQKVLVPALRDAAGRRQLVVVTHNANLAIVGDADQVVHCRASSGGMFSLTAASSADAVLAKSTVDLLEGTKDAFQSRSRHYDAVNALRS